MDFAVLTYLQGIKFGFIQGLAICDQAGVDVSLYTSFAKHYLGVYSSVLDNTAEKIRKREYDQNINTSVETLRKFNWNVLQHAKEAGLATQVSDPLPKGGVD